MSGFEHKIPDQYVSHDYLNHALKVTPNHEAFISKVRLTHRGLLPQRVQRFHFRPKSVLSKVGCFKSRLVEDVETRSLMTVEQEKAVGRADWRNDRRLIITWAT